MSKTARPFDGCVNRDHVIAKLLGPAADPDRRPDEMKRAGERQSPHGEDHGFPGDPESLLVPAIKWGSPAVLFTPAYWANLASRHRASTASQHPFRLGTTFKEECVACLLGGYGIRSDLGNAAFKAIVEAGLTASAAPTIIDVLNVLRKPLALPDGRKVRYRFAASKSAFVAAVLNSNPNPPRGLSHRGVRDWLTQFPGIGPKTASWIVRNWYGSDEVAIIDIHIYRAGLLAGFFGPVSNLSKEYRSMERRFLAFAAAIGFPPSHLDAVIWTHMRQAGRLAARCVRDYDTSG